MKTEIYQIHLKEHKINDLYWPLQSPKPRVINLWSELTSRCETPKNDFSVLININDFLFALCTNMYHGDKHQKSFFILFLWNS